MASGPGNILLLLSVATCYHRVGLTWLKHMGSRYSKKIRNGVGQLTFVEHALCPLDSRLAGVPNLIHESSFRYSDKRGRRRTGSVRVLCPLGLSPKDEFVLWGLLALTMKNPAAEGELHATRHYCLRRLGLIDARARRGGRQYRDFSSSIERLSSVQYQCDSFYDPIRAEHRRVSFGLFSYSLPLDDDAGRAWRFSWDPIFFEFAKATGGSLRFDWNIYRQLDPASRRFYLFLSKLFYRRAVTPNLDVADFAEQIVGIAPSVSLRDKKAKLRRCVRRLTQHGIVQHGEFLRLGKGRFGMVLHRGPVFESRLVETDFESPVIEQLIDLGFDIRGANRLLRRFDHRSVVEWVDITFAARNRHGEGFFRRGPPAYLTDNLKNAAIGKRTPPDWWGELRKKEQRESAQRAKLVTQIDSTQLSANAIEAVDGVGNSIFAQFLAAGQTKETAKKNARRFELERQAKLRK